MIIKILITFILSTLSILTFSNVNECADYKKYSEVAEANSKGSQCFQRKGHLIIFTPEKNGFNLTAFNIPRLKKAQAFSLVYEEFFKGELSKLSFNEEEVPLVVDDINKDGFDELVFVLIKNDEKEINVFSLNPKRQEYFGRLFFNSGSGKEKSPSLIIKKSDDYAVTQNGIKVISNSKTKLFYKAAPFSFNLK